MKDPVVQNTKYVIMKAMKNHFLHQLALMVFCLPLAGFAGVVINEVQSSNDQTILDENGESPDWVELYNGDPTNVNLSGWILTDKADKPKKADEWWRFPDGSEIAPGEHLVVFADSTGLDGPQPPEAKLEPDDDSLKANLVAWYRADDLTGTTVSTWTDKSGRGNNATGSAKLVTNVRNGHAALQFASASKQKFSIPLHNANFGLTSMSNVTVIIVGCPTTMPSSSAAKGLFDVSHPSSSTSSTSDKYQYNTYFEIYGTGGALRSRSGYYSPVISGASAVTKNTWCAMAFTTESTGREAALTTVYRNDELKASGQPASLNKTVFVSSSVMYLGNSQCVMKSDGTISAQGSFFDGYMAEVIIYNRALTAEEYEAVYNTLNAKYNLAGKSKAKHHTNFSISGSGETLTLMTPDKAVVDALTFGRIPCDCSYGRIPDGAADCAWFGKEDVSPGSTNGGTPYDSPLEPVVFSVERNVYDTTKTVELELSHPTNGVKIYYTTNRSDPTPANGIEYKEGQAIVFDKTTVVKATAVKDGHLPYRNVTAHSYIFLDQVAGQTKPADADPAYPDTWSDRVDGWTTASTPASYGFSTGVIKTDADKTALIAALTNAPIVSVTLSDSDLFSAEDGLYIHPNSMEDREPVQADVEWLTGDDVFGTSCGLDMHGAYSRRFDITAKKSFKLKFSGAFGAGSLDHAVLKDGGCETEEFKKLVLRGESNHHWTSMETDNQGGWPELGTYMHDQFLRGAQKLMSGFQAEGSHVHLFLNGMYWGLYNIADHVSDGFAATTWSGNLDKRKNYDVISNDGVRDGTADGWNAAKALAKKGFSNQAAYDAVTNVFDVVGYIDYLLIEWFSANEDWAENNNNWAVAGSAKLGVPYRYVLWDVDKTLRVTAKESSQMGYNLLDKSSGPMEIHAALKSNAEYRMLFTDRVQKHMFGEGALTVDSIVARYNEMADKVRPRLFAEEARWGSYQYDYWDKITDHRQSTRARYGLEDWDKERNRLTGENGWFSQRHATLIGQLKTANLWSDAFAKVSTITLNKDGTATLTVPDGTGVKVYYTLDGRDPREMFTGTAVGTEYASGTPIKLPKEGGTVKARVLSNGTTWSALTEVAFETRRNVFNTAENGKKWDDAANWSLGEFPNAPGETAVIGVPAATSGKGWRNIDIKETDITVGALEVTNGGWTNRIDNSKSGGSFTFCGEETLDETGGVAYAEAALTVTDETGAGLTIIDLDSPNSVRLGSDTVFTVNTVEGDANYGGLLIKGLIAGNGHNLMKSGPGRLTLACESAAASPLIDKLQCDAGIVAVLAPLKVGSVTKTGAELWVKMGSTDLAEACALALDSEGKCNPNIRLFVPTSLGGRIWYGGIVAKSYNSEATVSMYVQDEAGATVFDGQRWSPYADAEIVTKKLDDGRKTYEVKVPYLKPLVMMGDQAFYSVQEAIDAANSTNVLVFAVEPVVVGKVITANGDSGVVKDCYDVVQDGNTLTLKLSDAVKPEWTKYTEVKWFAGEMDNVQRKGFLTQVGLYYALGQGGEAKTEWIAGDGTPQFIEPPDNEEYEIMVSDVPQR